MIKTLIFDFDGTLFHTAPEIHRAINATLSDMGHHELEYEQVKNCIGQGLFFLLEHLELDIDMTADGLKKLALQFRQHYDQYFLESKPFPGMFDFISQCPQKLAVGSNKDVKYINACLEQKPWDQVEWLTINGGNSFPTKKPDPEMIEDIIKRSNCNPDEIAIIGDGLPDVEVAKNTGIYCVAVSYGYTPVEELLAQGAHVKIDKISELPRALGQF